MDEIRCSIKIEDRAEGVRLIGVLMPYNTEARDRREVFETGSLTWDDPKGIVVNRMHSRSSPIMRVVPIEKDGKLMIDSEIPDTAAGRDCASEVRSGLLASLSVEFRATKQTIVGGVRRIASAILTGAAVCDAGSYAAATVEARAKAERRQEADRHTREFML